MTKFKPLLAPALVAALGLGAAAPAMAHESTHYNDSHRYEQNYGASRYTPVRGASIRSDIYNLDASINRAAQRRTISWREASGLKRDAAQVKQLYARYARNGLTSYETRILKAKVDRIQIALRAERWDRDGRRG